MTWTCRYISILLVTVFICWLGCLQSLIAEGPYNVRLLYCGLDYWRHHYPLLHTHTHMHTRTHTHTCTHTHTRTHTHVHTRTSQIPTWFSLHRSRGKICHFPVCHDEGWGPERGRCCGYCLQALCTVSASTNVCPDILTAVDNLAKLEWLNACHCQLHRTASFI